jgi:peroxiredoxin
MKKLLLALLLQLPLLIYAQEKLNLKGELSALKNNKSIYLVHVADNQEKLDSAIIKDGKFEFDIPLAQPSIAILLLDHSGTSLKEQGPKDVYRFFITPGKAILKATDSISKATITGLEILKENDELVKVTEITEHKLKNLNEEFAALPEQERANEETMFSFQERYLKLLKERQDAIIEFIKKHPESYISLYSLNADLINDDMDVPQIQSLYDNLAPQLKENSLAISVKSRLEKAKITGLGVQVTDFEEKTPEGIPIKLSSYKGQYVLLDFWASWCGPCRQENPNLVNAYEKYKAKNFTVLGVSIDSSADAWKKAIKADGLVWTQLLDTTKQIAELYGIDAIPKNYLIDPSGKIIAKNLRGAALDAKLQEVFSNL